MDNLLKGDAEVTTRLQSADRRYRSEVVAAAKQPGWEPEPVVGSPRSSGRGTAALRFFHAGLGQFEHILHRSKRGTLSANEPIAVVC